MAELMAAVEQITRAAQADSRPQQALGFYRQVVQIQFNAWQYMESNLWASLVAHIFAGLDAWGKGKDQGHIFEQFRQKLKEKLAGRMQEQQEATARVQEATRALEQTQAAYITAQQKYEAKVEAIKSVGLMDVWQALVGDADVRRDIGTLERELGLPAVGNSMTSLQTALDQAERVREQGYSLLRALVAADRGWRVAAGVAAVLVVACAIGVGVAWLTAGAGQPWLAQTAALLTSGATVIGGLAAWLQRQGSQAAGWVKRVEETRQRLAARVTAQQEEQRTALARQEEELTRARDSVAAAERARLDAERNVAAARLDLAKATPDRLLSSFVQQRVSSSDYTKHLGLLALVRQDFQDLWELIDEWNNSQEEGPATGVPAGGGPGLPINRIVLYIDDLDRCPVEKVVEVLQAIHLLLALPLFVVVVAVDARWISKALQLRYPELLVAPTDGKRRGARVAAAPLDYLEKIFQIPYWLAPISNTGRGTMLAGLLNGRSTAGKVTGQALAHTVDLTPESLSIQPRELEFADRLVELLGHTPRAVKRFVNLYRLAKASLGPTEQVGFLVGASGPPDFQMVMFLLALVTGTPEIAAALMRAVFEAPADATEWAELCKGIDADAALATNGDWQRVKGWLQPAQAPGPLALDPPRLAAWARRVARYSFEVAPEWLG